MRGRGGGRQTGSGTGTVGDVTLRVGAGGNLAAGRA